MDRPDGKKNREIGDSVKGHEESNLQNVTPCGILFYYQCVYSIMSVYVCVCIRKIPTCGDKITALQPPPLYSFALFCFKYPTLSANQLNKTVYWNTVELRQNPSP